MQLQNTMSASALSNLKTEVDAYNKINASRATGQASNMGKNEFLKLLTVQLSKQDPLSPMKNTEFISQMAQFSALEQMTKVNSSLHNMASHMTKGQAQTLVGKHVSFIDPKTGQHGNGTVKEVWFHKQGIQLIVGSRSVLYEDITRVRQSAP